MRGVAGAQEVDLAVLYWVVQSHGVMTHKMCMYWKDADGK